MTGLQFWWLRDLEMFLCLVCCGRELLELSVLYVKTEENYLAKTRLSENLQKKMHTIYFLCILVAIFVMVWHRFTDNSSQYWVRIIRQILGRKLVNRLHIYLLKLLSPSCYLLAPIHSSGFSIYNFANIVIFYMSTVYFYRELSPTSHCMHTIFWNISLKNDENILN